jgi:hypothetical protein
MVSRMRSEGAGVHVADSVMLTVPLSIVFWALQLAAPSHLTSESLRLVAIAFWWLICPVGAVLSLWFAGRDIIERRRPWQGLVALVLAVAMLFARFRTPMG